MKSKFSIILFLLLPFYSSFGQKIENGTYLLSTGFTTTEITFKGKQKFDYLYSSCTGGQSGSGTYSFKDSSLLLAFENPKKGPLPEKPSIKRFETIGNKSQLNFTFHEQNKLYLLEGVILTFQKKSDTKTYGTVSNSAGSATLEIENTEFPVEIQIQYIGSKSKTIRLDSSGNCTINYPINLGPMEKLIKGDSLDFIIGKHDFESLEIRTIEEPKFLILKRKD